MKDIAYILIYLLTEVINYTLTYTVIFGFQLTKKIGKILLTSIILITLHVSVLLGFGTEISSICSMLSMLIIPMSLLECSKKKGLLIYPFVFFCPSIISVCCSFVISVIYDIPEHVTTNSYEFTIGCQLIPMVFLFIIWIYRKIKKRESYEVSLGIRQYILFYVVDICLFCMVGPIQVLSEGDITMKDVNVIGVAVSVASVVLIGVTIWQGIMENENIRLRELNKMSQKYMKLQKEYYMQLLTQDEKMRRFKHDFHAHMTALSSLCEGYHDEKINAYLEKIIRKSAIYDNKKYTGLNAVDAVIRELVSIAKNDEIEVEVTGNLADNINVLEYDLCTIFSNLINNAIEACRKIEDASLRRIHIRMGVYNKKIYIDIENSCRDKVDIRKTRLKSTKPESQYHGLGTGNIINTVVKYDGTIEYSSGDGWFKAEISM